jgi:hypothetical protein
MQQCAVIFFERNGRTEERTYGNALLDNCKTRLSTRNDLDNKFRHMHSAVLFFMQD